MRAGALLAIMALASCTRPPVAEAPRHHPTIVSLNPCSDAVLAEIADPGQLLAISHYSQNPASSSMDVARARQFRAVSGSVEEVLALKPDLVIVDLMMPRQSGFIVLERVKELTGPTIAVIMLTANAAPEQRAYAEFLGVDDFLLKPVTADQLLASVRLILRPPEGSHPEIEVGPVPSLG